MGAGLVVYVIVRLLLSAGWLDTSEVARTVLHRAVLIAWAIAVVLSYRAHRVRRDDVRVPSADAEKRELTPV